MVRYRLHCVGTSGNSFKVALFLSCAGIVEKADRCVFRQVAQWQ